MKRLASTLLCSFAGSMLPLMGCLASSGDRVKLKSGVWEEVGRVAYPVG
jgi:hypothetical protein